MKINLFVIFWCVYICCASIVFGGSNDDTRGQGIGFDLNKEYTGETSSDDQRSPNQQSNNRKNSNNIHAGSSAQPVSRRKVHINKENMHFKAVQRAKDTNTSYQKAYWAIKKEVFLDNMRINEPERFNARQEIQKSKSKPRKRDPEARQRWSSNKYNRLLKLRREGKITPQERIELAQQTKKMSAKRKRQRELERERQSKTSPKKD